MQRVHVDRIEEPFVKARIFAPSEYIARS